MKGRDEDGGPILRDEDGGPILPPFARVTWRLVESIRNSI